jgi:hypothetical protein
MAGTCNSVRCLLTSALSRAEVKGDFGGSLMRESSKVRVHAPIMEFTKSGSSTRHAVRPNTRESMQSILFSSSIVILISIFAGDRRCAHEKKPARERVRVG